MNTRLYHIIAVIICLNFLYACKSGQAEETDTHEDIKDLPRRTYSKGGVKFSLAQISGLIPVDRDSVQWANLLLENEDNGQVIYYFSEGSDQLLNSPQIRVEYIAKHLPGCESVDALKGWLIEQFVQNPQQGADILSEDKVFETMDGQKVEILEIHRPIVQVSDSMNYSEKYMAWGYADHGDRFVGFNFTATTIADYERNFDRFRNLIRSYSPEQ